MAIVRCGTLADFAQVMERCLVSFSEGNPSHPLFEEMFPDTIRPTEECMKQWLLVENRDEIVAGIQVVPRPLVIAGTIRLRASGLGNVFCYPTARRQGHMTTLLQTVGPMMKQAGTVINMLGGDRLRYGRHGWEHAGSARKVTLGGNMIRGREAPRVSAVELRRFRGAAADVERMREAYEKLSCRTERTCEQFGYTLERPGQSTWICDGPEGFAYVTLTGSRMAAYAGDEDALDKLIRFVLASRSVEVVLPPVDASGPLERLLMPYASHYSVVPAGMVRVVDLAGVLAAYRAVLDRRLGGWGGRVTLEMTDADQTVSIGGSEAGIELGDGPEGERISLRDTEMARLLFGPFPPCLGEMQDHELVRRAFPLPLHWHQLSHV